MLGKYGLKRNFYLNFFRKTVYVLFDELKNFMTVCYLNLRNAVKIPDTSKTDGATKDYGTPLGILLLCLPKIRLISFMS